MEKRAKQNKTSVYVGLLVLFILVAIIFYIIGRGKSVSLPAPNPSQTPDIAFCKPENIDSKIEFEGTAGSIYGTLTLQNKTSLPCYVVGDNYVDVRYDLRSVQNVTVVPQEKPQESLYQLEPHQTLYSQVRFQNGAQCGSETKTINVIYAYRITHASEVTFKNKDNQSNNSLSICSSNAKTKVEVWPLSTSKNR